jgi:hypothetical protein
MYFSPSYDPNSPVMLYAPDVKSQIANVVSKSLHVIALRLNAKLGGTAGRARRTDGRERRPAVLVEVERALAVDVALVGLQRAFDDPHAMELPTDEVGIEVTSETAGRDSCCTDVHFPADQLPVVRDPRRWNTDTSSYVPVPAAPDRCVVRQIGCEPRAALPGKYCQAFRGCFNGLTESMIRRASLLRRGAYVEKLVVPVGSIR